MLRPARLLGRLTSPRRRCTLTGPPVYGRACSNRSLPQPESAITTRPNHLLPRRDSHPFMYQRTKAAPEANEERRGEFQARNTLNNMPNGNRGLKERLSRVAQGFTQFSECPMFKELIRPHTYHIRTKRCGMVPCETCRRVPGAGVQAKRGAYQLRPDPGKDAK